MLVNLDAVTSSAEDLGRRWIECWQPDLLSSLKELVDVDYVHHAMTGQELDLAGFVTGLQHVFASFPDINYEILHVLSQGELAAFAVVGRGTHLGNYLGVPPTGNGVIFRGSYHCRVRNGKILEDWDVFDLLSPALKLGATITPR